MKAITSTHFISAAATGENWRDISKKVLDELETAKSSGFRPDIGFLYITDALAEDASSILTLFKSVTGVARWTGCAALGVCANAIEYVDKPAISVMLGQVGADHVRAFHAQAPDFKKLHHDLEPWLNRHDPMLVVIHADPFAGAHPVQAIEEIEALVGGFMVGGLTSSRTQSAIFSETAMQTGMSGFVFSQDVVVATSLTQGCVPMGPMHEISKADHHVIAYLDGRTPFDVFSEDMKKMAQQRLGYEPKEMIIKEGPEMPFELMQMLDGEAHVAFPVTGSDMADFLVRNIMAIDPETGVIAVADMIEDGQKMMFVHRDDETVRADLSQTLVALRNRVIHDAGSFAPKAALYVSCVARAGVSFGGDEIPGGEMKLIREILGDLPITGFYANGEISNNRLYGYTGVLTLFL
jgi:small ligand-binding sensory domain FIST